jgi:alkanesulfonate monooxygenase SsuD/methylene tetrahydromethanopterin reductase-like flavin-dependent oxidoreductase (luciferase family)
MDIALMVEGQDGLNWDRWRAIARTAEEVGFAGLYRSDHFTNPVGPYKDSLECWISLAYLATNTQRLEFGPMVSPMSFRHPAMLVRQAAAVADLSDGRLQFALGAGWQDREHTNYSYHLGSVPERMARFREAALPDARSGSVAQTERSGPDRDRRKRQAGDAAIGRQVRG